MIEPKTLGDLIDCTDKEFTEFCDSKDLGYNCNLHALLIQTYNQAKEAKDELVHKIGTKEIEPNEENKNTLKILYAKLIVIEKRVFMLRGMLQSKSKEKI